VIPIPAITVPKSALSFGPGYIYIADPGISAPTNTVAGSVFTDTWPVGWNPLGITTEGHTLTVDLDTDAVEAAEYVDPLLNVVTGRTISAELEMMQISLTNFKRVFNGGTKSTSGSGATLLTTYTLPKIGSEVRCQLGWESNDGTERWWAMQVFNTGSVAIKRQKGADNATLPVTWTMEPDGSGEPVYFASAGPVRG
jgi:hypothetical protein